VDDRGTRRGGRAPRPEPEHPPEPDAEAGDPPPAPIAGCRAAGRRRSGETSARSSPKGGRRTSSQDRDVIPRATMRVPISRVQLALRAALAAALSLALARLIRLHYPIHAMLAAVIVTDLSPAETSRLGLRRLAATVWEPHVGPCSAPSCHPGRGRWDSASRSRCWRAWSCASRTAPRSPATSAASSCSSTVRTPGPTRSFGSSRPRWASAWPG
jgi:hypothetical protein